MLVCKQFNFIQPVSSLPRAICLFSPALLPRTGIWDKTTGMLGATGRDQVTSVVVLYGPRTTALVACDDGVYEFTCGEGDKWFASREQIKIKPVSPLCPSSSPVAY